MKFLVGLFSFIFLSSVAFGKIVFGITQEWGSFNPVTINLASSSAISHFLYRGLTVMDQAGRVIPDLAVKIPSLKDGDVKKTRKSNTTGLEVVWQIRDTAKWGDGTDITCKDLKFGWEVGRNKNVSVGQRSIYENIHSIEFETSKAKICKVKYKSANWNFDRETPALLPFHLESSVFESFKDKPLAYEQGSTYQKMATNPGLYNGPYLVKEYKIGSHLSLTPNQYFFGERPKIDEIWFKYISDSGTLKANLVTGSITGVSAVGFPPDLALSLDRDFSQDNASLYRIEFRDSPIFQGLFINNDSEVLKDRNVRLALSHAINKEELSKAFFSGKLRAANTFISPTDQIYEEKKSEYSPKEALKYLQKSGWKLDAKGKQSKDGKTLAVLFRTSAGLRVLETIQTFVCSEFLKVGVECIVKNQPPRVLLGDTITKGDFDIAMFGQPVIPDVSPRGTFSSFEIPSESNSFAGGNIVRYKNKEVDKLIEEFDSEWSSKKRMVLFKKIENLVLNDRPFIPLYHRKEAFVLPKGLKNFQSDVSGTGFLFPEKWSL
jgi:peptide/nickel transport system substrate-binding protein